MDVTSFFRNLGILIAIAGILHLRLFIFRSQGERYQYNSNKLDESGKQWMFNKQTRDNIFGVVLVVVLFGQLTKLSFFGLMQIIIFLT